MRAVLTLVFVVILTLGANAKAVRGWGAATCPQWKEIYRKDPTTVGELSWSWAFGFLSGFNFLYISPRNPPRNLEALDLNQFKAFLVDYCNKHPDKAFYEGVLEELRTLPPLPAQER
jgi:hypothetical protein